MARLASGRRRPKRRRRGAWAGPGAGPWPRLPVRPLRGRAGGAIKPRAHALEGLADQAEDAEADGDLLEAGEEAVVAVVLGDAPEHEGAQGRAPRLPARGRALDVDEQGDAEAATKRARRRATHPRPTACSTCPATSTIPEV